MNGPSSASQSNGRTKITGTNGAATDLEALHEEIVNVHTTHAIVEGPNDKRALEKLGFTRVTHLKGPLYACIEAIEDEEVLLLTDLDEHGEHLYRRLYDELTRRGVRVNNRLRHLLVRTPVRHIEGLAAYLERMPER
jgi:5S rRNA maturation endonuclease (ribonuclease M5)